MPVGVLVAAAVGVPSLQEYLLGLSVSWALVAPAPMRVGAVICEPPVDLRLTVVALLRPKCDQSAVPSVVRLTEAGGVATVPLRLPAEAKVAKNSPVAEAIRVLAMARIFPRSFGARRSGCRTCP